MPRGSLFLRKLPFSIHFRIALLILGLVVSEEAGAQLPLSQIGKWTPASGSWGHMAIHMALLRGAGGYHSKLLAWDDDPQHQVPPVFGTLWGWNAGTGLGADCSTYPTATFQPLALDTSYLRNIFCSGHSTLSTGELLMTGGDDYLFGSGETQSVIFRPNSTPQWIQQGEMHAGRFYPTNVTFPDGKVLTFSGSRFTHMVVFGGTDQSSVLHDDINRLGLNKTGSWLSNVTRGGATNWPSLPTWMRHRPPGSLV